jgi:hypothetical protein
MLLLRDFLLELGACWGLSLSKPRKTTETFGGELAEAKNPNFDKLSYRVPN